jgi:hypothetical protein
MIVPMTVMMMIASVGIAVSTSTAGSVPNLNASEAPVAATFTKYKKAVECWAGVNPGAAASNLSPATLKATNDATGKPCMHPSYVGAPGIGSTVSATTIYVYMTPATVMGMPSPAEKIRNYYAPSTVGGIVTSTGQLINGKGITYSFAGVQLPVGSVVYQTSRL